MEEVEVIQETMDLQEVALAQLDFVGLDKQTLHHTLLEVGILI